MGSVKSGITIKQTTRWSLMGVVLTFSVSNLADEAYYVSQPPVIDGVVDDAAWKKTGNGGKDAPWYPLNELILGEAPGAEDFSGSYTLRWDEQYLYLQVKIQDDVLYDSHSDPLEKYWDEDCLEIFIDEDQSGGNHLFNFNAYAYHVGLDNQVVDYGPLPPAESGKEQGGPALFNHHVTSAWKRSAEAPFEVNWELAVAIYPQHTPPDKEKQPLALTPGKTLGFMLAYCDNDGSKEREHFVGSHPIQARNGDKNLGYIDASVFDSLTLKKGKDSDED